MSKQEFLNKCKETRAIYGDRAVVTREICDTRTDYWSMDGWYITFMTEEALENLYEQYVDAPMIKVKFTFGTWRED